MNRLPGFLKLSLWLSIALLATLVCYRIKSCRSLEAELDRLRLEQAALQSPPAAEADRRPAPEASGKTTGPGVMDGLTLMKNLQSSMEEQTDQLRRGFGWRNPVMKPAHDLIQSVGPEGWLALLETDSSFHFAYSEGDDGESFAGRISQLILFDCFGLLARSDPPKALGMLEKAATGGTGKFKRGVHDEVRRAVSYWAESDPVRAIRWAKNMASIFSDGTETACAALSIMARTDTAGAWRALWGEGLPLGQALISIAGSLRSREDLDLTMAELTAHSGKADQPIPAATLDRTDLPPGTSCYAFACADFAGRLAVSRSAGEAREFLEKWAMLPADREVAGLALTNLSLVPEAGAEASSSADWLMGFVPADRQSSTARQLVETWAENDFSQPAGWLDRQPPGEWRDEGIAALCRKLGTFDPPAAAAWAAKISDPDLRQEIAAGLPAGAP